MTDNTELLSHMRLHFHVQHPSYDEVWLEGFDEGQNEFNEEDNPYPEDSMAYQFWNDGWWAAFYGEAPLFNIVCESAREIPIVRTEHVPAEVSLTSENKTKAHEPFGFTRFVQLVVAFLCGTAVIAVCYDLAM